MAVVARRLSSGPTSTVRRLGDATFSERTTAAGHVFDDLWVHKGSVQFRVEVFADLGAKPLRKLAVVVLANLPPSVTNPS
jgi:hypothetical protein